MSQARAAVEAALARARELGVRVLTPDDYYDVECMDKRDRRDLVDSLVSRPGRFHTERAITSQGVLRLAGADAGLAELLEEGGEDVFLAPPGYSGDQGYTALIIEYDAAPGG